MRKLSINRIKLMLVAALVAIAFACVGFMTFAKAENTFTSLADIDVTMDGYALIVEGEDGINGLEFTISAPQAQYSAMVGSVGEGKAYASVETGIIIAPAYYNDEIAIDQDSLFNSPEYDWANYVDGEWVYSGDKIQVININANDWVDLGDTVTYSGGIVDIRPENENVAMYSVGYIKLVDSEGVATYKFTDSSEISVVAAAVQAYDSLSGSQKIWVDTNWLDILPIIEEDVVLKDVAGAATYNVLDTVTANEGVKNIMDGFTSADGLSATMTDASGNVVDINLENPVVDVTADLLRVWDIEIKAGEFVLYQGTADLYNKNAKPVWNTISEDNLDALVAYYPSEASLLKLPVVDKAVSSIDGKTTIAVSNVANWAGIAPGEAFFSMMPVHTKEYYQQYVGKDVTMNLGFYIETSITPESGKYIVNQAAVGFNNGKPSTPKANEWNTAALTLDTIVENWDIIVNGAGEYTWDTRDDLAMFYALMTDYKPSADLIYHFTGFELAMDVAALAVKGGEILVKLDDVADKTALDLTAYMKAEDVETINGVAAINTLTYEMKGYSIADTIAVTDLTAVDVSSATEAAYILQVKSGENVIYSATIDLYTSTSPVVWADTLTAQNVLIHSGGYTTGRATPTTAKAFEIIDASTITEETDPLYGKTGTYAKTVSTTSENVIVSVLSLHSKAYYKEMVSNQNYVLTIDKYVAATGSSKLSGMGMQGATNYGRWNTWSNYRGGDGTLNTWGEKPGIGLYMSLDNYLLRSEDDPCYFTDAWYDFYKVHSAAAKQYNMMQFEVQVASADNPVTIYISGAKIVEASETLLSASKVADMTASSEYEKLTLEYDFANEKKVDLTTVFDANNLAKYKVYASKYVSSSYFKWTITFSDSTTVEVKPSADGTTELDLDALASDGTTVHSKLLANAKVKIVATSPSQPYPQPTNIAIFNATFKNLPAITPAE